jgi:hypothetical protein
MVPSQSAISQLTSLAAEWNYCISRVILLVITAIAGKKIAAKEKNKIIAHNVDTYEYVETRRGKCVILRKKNGREVEVVPAGQAPAPFVPCKNLLCPPAVKAILLSATTNFSSLLFQPCSSFLCSFFVYRLKQLYSLSCQVSHQSQSFTLGLCTVESCVKCDSRQ